MSAIWSALVPETTKTVDKYLSEILAELTKELTSPQVSFAFLAVDHDLSHNLDPDHCHFIPSWLTISFSVS